MYMTSGSRVSSGVVTRIGGFFLVLTGWAIVLCALMLLRHTALTAFTLTGLGVELFGMALVVRTFLPHNLRRRS